MRNFNSAQVVGPTIWQALLSGEETLYVVEDLDLELRVFGGPGEYHLVLSDYDADSESLVEYTFLPLQDEEIGRAAGLTLELLKEHDYNLVQLMDWLNHGDFKFSEVGPAVFFCDLAISRSVLRQKAA